MWCHLFSIILCLMFGRIWFLRCNDWVVLVNSQWLYTTVLHEEGLDCVHSKWKLCLKVGIFVTSYLNSMIISNKWMCSAFIFLYYSWFKIFCMIDVMENGAPNRPDMASMMMVLENHLFDYPWTNKLLLLWLLVTLLVAFSYFVDWCFLSGHNVVCTFLSHWHHPFFFLFKYWRRLRFSLLMSPFGSITWPAS